MSTDELTALTSALQTILDEQCEATKAAHRQVIEASNGNGTRRPHAPRSGRRPTLALRDRLLATILSRRLSLPPETLAHLFNSNRSTIRRAIHNTQQLLDQHGTTITPEPTPPHTLIMKLAQSHP